MCVFKLAHDLVGIPRLLKERLRVPLASAGSGEEIAAVNVDGASQAWNGIDHGMDDIASERFGIALSKRLCADCFELATACDAAPEKYYPRARYRCR
jgi:hypothetical protein